MEERGVGILKVLSQYFLEGTKDNQGELQQDCRCPDLDKTRGLLNTKQQY
jgi:hypothetical protein